MSQSAPSTTPVLEKAVYVSNVSPKANETTLREFFSFCGKIEQLTLRSTSDATGRASEVQECIVRFAEENATKTALLLTNALILDRPITVVRYDPSIHSEQTQKTPAVASTRPAIVSSTPAQPTSYTSSIASVLAAGYSLTTDAINKAKEYDDQYKVSSNVLAAAEGVSHKVAEIDQSYKISETTKAWSSAAGAKISELDKSIGVSSTVSSIGTATSGAVKQAASSEPVVATVGVLKQSGATIATYAGGVKAEAAKVLEIPTVKAAGETIKSTTGAVKSEFSGVYEETNKKIKEKEEEKKRTSGEVQDEGKEALLRIASSDSVSSTEDKEEEEEKEKPKDSAAGEQKQPEKTT